MGDRQIREDGRIDDDTAGIGAGLIEHGQTAGLRKKLERGDQRDRRDGCAVDRWRPIGETRANGGNPGPAHNPTIETEAGIGGFKP